MRFPDSSVGKESTCNAEDPSLIPGSGRSAGEGIGYPLQYSWPSLVTQLVKNPPAMRETWVQSLGWDNALEKGRATHSSILAWRIQWTVWSMGSQRVGHDWATFTFIVFSTGWWERCHIFESQSRKSSTHFGSMRININQSKIIFTMFSWLEI